MRKSTVEAIIVYEILGGLVDWEEQVQLVRQTQSPRLLHSIHFPTLARIQAYWSPSLGGRMLSPSRNLDYYCIADHVMRMSVLRSNKLASRIAVQYPLSR